MAPFILPPYPVKPNWPDAIKRGCWPVQAPKSPAMAPHHAEPGSCHRSYPIAPQGNCVRQKLHPAGISGWNQPARQRPRAAAPVVRPNISDLTQLELPPKCGTPDDRLKRPCGNGRNHQRISDRKPGGPRSA